MPGTRRRLSLWIGISAILLGSACEPPALEVSGSYGAFGFVPVDGADLSLELLDGRIDLDPGPDGATVAGRWLLDGAFGVVWDEGFRGWVPGDEVVGLGRAPGVLGAGFRLRAIDDDGDGRADALEPVSLAGIPFGELGPVVQRTRYCRIPSADLPDVAWTAAWYGCFGVTPALRAAAPGVTLRPSDDPRTGPAARATRAGDRPVGRRAPRGPRRRRRPPGPGRPPAPRTGR